MFPAQHGPEAKGCGEVGRKDFRAFSLPAPHGIRQGSGSPWLL